MGESNLVVAMSAWAVPESFTKVTAPEALSSLVPEAEAALVGAPATRASFEAAGIAALQNARGYGHNDFKIELMQRAIVRVAEEAGARA